MIFVIFMWLTFAGNFMTIIVPFVFFKRPVTDFVPMMSGMIGLMFSYNQLWLNVTAPENSIIYYCSMFWIQILTMAQFFFISFKYMRHLLLQRAVSKEEIA